MSASETPVKSVMIEERVSPENPDWNFENHRKVYVFFAHQVSGASVLDVGCGAGYGSELLRTEGGCSEYFGVDYDPGAVSMSERKFGAFGSFAQMDAHELKFEDRSFDVVVSSENLEHLEDPERALSEKARVLKDDGWVMIGTPNKEMFSPGEPGSPNPFHKDEFQYLDLWKMMKSHWEQVCIIENFWESDFELGRKQKAVRLQSGQHGVLHKQRGHYKFCGKVFDMSLLHNTHSFMALATQARKRTVHALR